MLAEFADLIEALNRDARHRLGHDRLRAIGVNEARGVSWTIERDGPEADVTVLTEGQSVKDALAWLWGFCAADYEARRK